MVRIDFHTHSSVSADGWMAPTELVDAAMAAGIDRVAITDHDEIHGAVHAFAERPNHVIVGEEVRCANGTHLIGLFLSGRIPSGLSVDETARRIRNQGGIVYAPHPFAYAWRANWHARQSLAVADVAEVFNSRAFLPHWNRRAWSAAQDCGLPTAAGSDSHFAREFGRAYTEMPDFSTVGEFRQALLHARPVGLGVGSPLLHCGSRAVAEIRRMRPNYGRQSTPQPHHVHQPSRPQTDGICQSSTNHPARPLGA